MPLNKCQLVRSTSKWVYKHSQHVKVIPQNIQSILQLKYTPFNDFECHNIQLTEEQSLAFLFAMDAMNFCFWPNQNIEYEFLASSVKNGVISGRLSAQSMLTISQQVLVSQVFKNDNIPLVDERARILNEVAQVVLQKYQGSFVKLVKSSEGSAINLLNILTSNFPNFQDHAIYKGHQIHFYKRAQILIGDIYAHFKGAGLGKFCDIKELTMFADYRVPQMLRQMGILQYSEELSKRVDSKEQIPHGGQFQVQIRAATIVAVELIKESLRQKSGKDVLSIQVDWHLWQQGEKNLKTLKPHHRVLSIYY